MYCIPLQKHTETMIRVTNQIGNRKSISAREFDKLLNSGFIKCKSIYDENDIILKTIFTLTSISIFKA